MLEKSIVLLSQDLLTALSNSPVPLVAQLFVQSSSRQVQAQQSALRRTARESAAAGKDGGTEGGKEGSKKAMFHTRRTRVAESSRQPTMGIRFAEQLGELVELVDNTTSHFVRCAAEAASRKQSVGRGMH